MSADRLTPAQTRAILAAWLGWALDAFDFFLMVFALKAISETFHTDIKAASEALFLTLAARPVGALVFGWLADRYGRRPVLMAVVVLFSGFSFATGFARSLPELLMIRAAFGFAMGGEWGIGVSLVMETIPARLRGWVSGLLQSGYSMGYLLAALAFWLLFDRLGWRGLFMLGALPALLVALIRMGVDESPVILHRAAADRLTIAETLREIGRHWKMALYLVILMTGMNFLSHGTQDLYPTFLQKQHHFDTVMTGRIALVMNVGAIAGTFAFGLLSERLGRRRALVSAAIWAILMVPLWTLAASPFWLAAGAFLVQAGVQGAWAVIPAHLSELSPGKIRAMFPGFVYQLGNLIASRNAVIQSGIAEAHHDNYALALGSVCVATALGLIAWVSFGPERRGVALD